MNIKIVLSIVLFSLFSSIGLFGQEKGRFSGDLQLNTKFFEPDSARGAKGNPFYDYLFYGAETWLNLRYSISGFDIGLRFDAFQNSNLFNPNREISEQGIGLWYINKKIDKLNISVGHFYEQFGSGSTYRSYENRGLGIDQAIMGIRLTYEANKNLTLKAFTGRLKNRFELYRPIIKGLTINALANIGKAQLQPGATLIGRTIDTKTMETLAAEISSNPCLKERFEPKYNSYASSLYNTISIGDFSWYVEGAYKTEDVLRRGLYRESAATPGVLITDAPLFKAKNGYLFYSSLTYSTPGFGMLAQAKYTKNFDFRVSPNELLNNGVINFLPSLTRTNTYRLLSKYSAPTQPLGEWGYQVDAIWSPTSNVTINVNYADIEKVKNTLLGCEVLDESENKQLFREIYLDANIHPEGKKWKSTVGVQALDYNQKVYQQKGNMINTLTPFMELSYKFTPRKSLRIESQFLMVNRNSRLFGSSDNTPQDKGDWIWGLAEYSIAPKWSFAVGNMYNFKQKLHFPTFLAAHNQKTTRFVLSYVKQPDGIVCTGGVCRYEPAFSGVKFDVTTNF